MTKKQSIKYIVLALFLVMTIVSVVLMGGVKINYNISDYLDESTETKISLNIIENDFGMTGNIQVMVEDVDVATAHKIAGIIKDIDNVLLVNFDQSDPSYYKDGDALFAVIVQGDEYSETANAVLDDIKAELDELFEGRTNYGGAVVEKRNMRETLKSEIFVILGIAIVFAIVIMLLMAKSWLEPIILIASSGVAVFINLGTNVFFDDISYITNAVAAILQLALSVDYSIVLLHEYRHQKQFTDDREDAMWAAMKQSFKPIFASALTTAAGLFALFFMTMKIGKDIGAVLTKGIAISAVTAMTLLPALLICLDKVMLKTAKKDLVISGKGLCKIARKARVPIVAFILILVTLCGVLQSGNTYSFTDSANPNQEIIDKFGASNTVVVVYPNKRLDWNDENKLAEKLKEFKTEDGKTPFQYHTGYSSTVIEPYSIEKAASKLNIPKEMIKILFAMYHTHNNDPHNREIESIDFVNFAIDFLTPDEGEGGETPEVVRTLQILSGIYDIVNGEHTADEMYSLVSTGVMADSGLSRFQIDQMYGLYLWNRFDNTAVDFETMLDYMVELTEDPDGMTLMSTETAEQLKELADGLETFKEQMGKVVTESEFIEFGHEKFGEAWWVEAACGYVFKGASKDGGKTAKIIDVLRKVGDVPSWIIPDEFEVMIENYSYVYDVIDDSCPYTEFIPRLKKVVLALSNEEREITPTNEDVQQAYIMYFRTRVNAIPNDKVKGIDFVDFVNLTIETNATVRAKVSEPSRLKLLDVATIDAFISDHETYLYTDMTARLNQLRKDVKSLTSTDPSVPTPAPTPLTEDDIYAIYLAYVGAHEEGASDDIIALDLLNYVDTYKDDKDHVLYGYMTPENKEKIAERKQAIENVKVLFEGTNYNRMLLAIDLPSEGEESTAFVDYLLKAVKEIYGDEAHIAGHMVSTVDLQNTFESDNKIITWVTIVSILLIIMLIFTSLSLPIVLVLVIQGAIWISMSMSLITGSMFFMSYIIATCILMGATIDYGILMSNTYVEARATMDKKDALLKAVNTALPTVFTSGLILTICGFIVGWVASQTSISTVGTLLGKGALVSSLMITLVLPSILYLLDAFILKLSFKINLKKILKRKKAVKEKEAE